MDIDPRTYPTRMFIRFVAQQQLTADATGKPVTMTMQRLGREPYAQTISPGGDFSLFSRESADSGLELEMGISIAPVVMSSDQANEKKSPVNPAHPEAMLANSAGDILPAGVDIALFEEIVKTTFNPSNHPELYKSCGTAKAAAAVEVSVISEIVSTYRQIVKKRDCPIVQGLNNLL